MQRLFLSYLDSNTLLMILKNVEKSEAEIHKTTTVYEGYYSYRKTASKIFSPDDRDCATSEEKFTTEKVKLIFLFFLVRE